MDLISREAAKKAFPNVEKPNDDLYSYLAPNYVREVLSSLPSVPAVPLNKLCEWLAERYEPPYSLVEIEKLKWPIDFRQQKEMWMVALTKWMEGLDGTD